MTDQPVPQLRRTHVPGGIPIHDWLEKLGFARGTVIFNYLASDALVELLRHNKTLPTYPAATGTVRLDEPRPLQDYEVQAWQFTGTVTADPTQGAYRGSQVRFIVTEIAVGGPRLVVYEQLIERHLRDSGVRRMHVATVFTPVIA